MDSWIIDGLVEAFLAGPWDADGLADRGGRILRRRYRWLRPLVRRIMAAFPVDSPRPRAARLAAFLRADERLNRAAQKFKPALRFDRLPQPAMAPAPGPAGSWPVPSITTPAELGRLLELEPNQLDWFADCQRRERSSVVEPLRHYRYEWVNKRSGSLRLLEAPKPRLKKLQRRVLDAILAPIPPHDAAHGFRTGRSVTSFVGPHVGRPIVLKMDLQDFFATITAARVVSIFLTAGYPEPVARRLAGLCTNTVPRAILERAAGSGSEPERSLKAAIWRAGQLYRVPHLPQGAPTSPALANLAAYRLDARLAGLARAAGARYTRYADDLVFSGDEDFARSIGRFPIHVAAIALEEGFAVQHRKTRVMRRGRRQRAAGVVINEKINMPRDDYDRLKAILCNCVRHGPHGQNRAGVPDFRAHLAGRVAHAARLNPERGRRLARLFEQIVW
jgi:retron-type reverse transcriptase